MVLLPDGTKKNFPVATARATVYDEGHGGVEQG